MNNNVFVILLLTGFSVPCTSFPYAYFFVKENKTWEDAQTYCVTEYTALAQVNNQENLTAMMNTSPSGYTGKAWIGLYATLVWTWVDGQVPTFTYWLLGQPGKSNGNALCASVAVGLWSSAICSQKKSSICFDGANYFVVSMAMTWMDAEANCKSQASNLAIIPDIIANAEILAVMASTLTVEAWIGLKTTQVWQWSETSENYTYRNWQPGQPYTQYGGPDCAAVVAQDGNWTDEQCSTQYPFFCHEIYKSRTTVTGTTIQSSANMENPNLCDAVLQQLHATLVKHGVTNFKMTWKNVPVKQTQKSVTATGCALTLS